MILDDEIYHEGRPEQLTSKQIVKKIWASPNQVFKSIGFYPPKNGLNASIFGVILCTIGLNFLDNALLMSDFYAEQKAVYFVFIKGLLISLSVYFFSALCNWLGGLPLSGKASLGHLFKMLTISMLPYVAFDLLRTAMRLFIHVSYGFESGEVLQAVSSFANSNTMNGNILSAIIFIWCMVLLVIGLKYTQHFSTGKAVLNMVLGFVIMLLPLIGLFVLNDLGRLAI